MLGPDPHDGDFVDPRPGRDRRSPVSAASPGRDPLLREVVESRTAVLAATPGDLLTGRAQPAYGSTVAVPLYSHDVVIGVLVALRRGRTEPRSNRARCRC